MALSRKVNRVHFGLQDNKFFKTLFRLRINDILLCIVLLVIYGALNDAPPYEREFYINDLSISHTFTEKEHVSTVELFIYALLVPFLALIILALIFTNEHRIYVTWISFVGFVLSISVNSFLTGMLKNWIGRPRPDFISRCEVKSGTKENTYVWPQDVCTTTDISKLRDGMRSCPSGHSSTSFAGLGYLTWWLIGQTAAYHKRTGAWRVCFSFIPSLFAGLIAISRTEDYRHRYSDVALGSIIGAICAYFAYKRNFPAYNTSLCYIPCQLIEENNLENNEVNEFDDGSAYENYQTAYQSDDIETQRYPTTQLWWIPIVQLNPTTLFPRILEY